MFHVPEKYRVRTGPMASDERYGNNGQFLIKHNGIMLGVQASDGEGWEHVSVSTARRCPTWEEMCFIVSTFWDSDDMVVQFHPPKDRYVNYHPYCLHLWRKANTNNFCEVPPTCLV